jgi:hypothetical protein
MARIQFKLWRAPLAALKSVPPTGLAEGEIGIASETNTLYKRPDGNSLADLIPLGVQGKATVIHCRLCSSINVVPNNYLNTTGNPIVIDQTPIALDDTILLTGQSDPSKNGLYTVKAGNWIRTVGAEIWDNLVSAIFVITEGVQLTQTVWFCTSDLYHGILDTSPVYLRNIVNVDLPFESDSANIQANQVTANIGSLDTIPRADHIHPTDLTRAPINSPNLTGTPTAPTPSSSDTSTRLATTEFVSNKFLNNFELSSSKIKMDGIPSVGVLETTIRADHIHPTDTSRASIESPNFIGIPTAETASVGTATTQLATTEFVKNEVDRNFESSLSNIRMDGLASVGNSKKVVHSNHVHPTDITRAPIESPNFTGVPTALTPDAHDSSTRIATTEFIQNTIDILYETSSDNLQMDEENGYIGDSNKVVHSNHIHPTDTTRAPIESPNFTGIAHGVTALTGTVTTQLATTEFVANELENLYETSLDHILMDGYTSLGTEDKVARSDHVHPTDITRAPIESPNFIGVPLGPTPRPNSRTNQFSTTDYVGKEFDLKFETFIENIKMDGDVSVGVLDKIARIDHVHPTDTTRSPIRSPNFLGVPTALTAKVKTSTTQLATTEFVGNEIIDKYENLPFNIKMNGPISVGTLDKIARSDHVHPIDITRAPINSPNFTGVPSGATARVRTSTTQLATTEFVAREIIDQYETLPSNIKMNGDVFVGRLDKVSRSDHVHPIDVTRAPIHSPILTGVPTAPTPEAGTSSAQLATTEFIRREFTERYENVGSNIKMNGVLSAGGLDTLARADHIHPTDITRAPVQSPEFTGYPLAPTPATPDRSNKIATTEFVKSYLEETIDLTTIGRLTAEELASLIGPAGPPGRDGRDGATGKDGTNGTNGRNGRDGKDGANGKDGKNGDDGKDGKDGQNGTHGQDGNDGKDGKDGQDGCDGQDGTDGFNGQNGINGNSGTNGTNGTNGLNGTNGRDGTNGIAGTNGTNGANGAIGLNGTAGTNGLNGTAGTNGLNGTTGINGTNGTAGTNGLNGLPGTNGTAGINGTNGDNGQNGLNGRDGTSITGADGRDGIDGVGTQGPQGDRGPQGDPGTPATGGTTGPIHIDTGTTGSLPANRITGLPTGGDTGIINIDTGTTGSLPANRITGLPTGGDTGIINIDSGTTGSLPTSRLTGNLDALFPAYSTSTGTGTAGICQRLPSGFIIQAGFFDNATLANAALLSKTFPVSFTQPPFVIFNIGHGITPSVDTAYTLNGQATATQLQVKCSVANLGFYYLAIGR